MNHQCIFSDVYLVFVSNILTHAIAIALALVAPDAHASIRCEVLFRPKIQASAEASAGIVFGEKVVNELRLRLAQLRMTHPQDFAPGEHGSERMQQLRSENLRIAVERMQLLRSGKFRIAVAANVQMRAEILKNGLKNLHETGTTFGRNDIDQRNAAESHLAGLPLDGYLRLPAEFKPKYGFLLFEKDGDFPWLAAPPTESMGDFYILKPTVHSRTTATRGDSLVAHEITQKLKNGIDPWTNLPGQYERLRKYYYELFDMPFPEVWRPTAWRDQFLPLDAIDLIAPKGAHPIEIDLVEHFLFNNSYLEGQVWGPLRPAHIHALAIDRAPQRDERRNLNANMIADYSAAGVKLYFKHTAGTFLRVSDFWPTIEKNIKMGQHYSDAVKNAFKTIQPRPLSILEI